MGDSLVAAPSALDQTDLDTNILGVYRVRAYITDPRHCSRVRRLWTDDLDRDTLTTFGFEFARCTAEQFEAFVGRVEQRRDRRDIPRAEDGISALSSEEQHRLLDGLKDRRTPHMGTLVPLLLLTGMRAGEALSLTWGQADLIGRTLTVGRAKTSNGTGRVIPINQ